MTIQRLAKEATNAFTTKQRGDKSIVDLVDGTATWIGEMCHAPHGDLWPDDYRYLVIRDAVEAETDEADDLDDLAHEFADNVDVYTGRLCTVGP